MNRDEAIKLLIEFFNDAYDTDPDGVDDWFCQNDDDLEAFMEALQILKDEV
jgi:hypothetical protein